MSKVTEVKVEIKQGLPNYSSQTASVVVVADEGEGLKVVETIRAAKSKILQGFKA